MKLQWAKFIVVLVLYLLFLYWVKSWWGLLIIPFIFDIYITKKIKWQWWKEEEGPVKWVMSWVDATGLCSVHERGDDEEEEKEDVEEDVRDGGYGDRADG